MVVSFGQEMKPRASEKDAGGCKFFLFAACQDFVSWADLQKKFY